MLDYGGNSNGHGTGNKELTVGFEVEEDLKKAIS